MTTTFPFIYRISHISRQALENMMALVALASLKLNTPTTTTNTAEPYHEMTPAERQMAIASRNVITASIKRIG